MITLALREWNLAQPAWKPFLRLDQLDLGALLWVVWRSRELSQEVFEEVAEEGWVSI